MSDLKSDLKAAFTTGMDPTVKPTIDAFYEAMGDVIRKYSSNVKITYSETEPEDPEPNEIWIKPNP
jgi:hypothetical protein